MTVTIYTLDCPNTGEVRYVGKTINPVKRFKSHLFDKALANRRRSDWIKSLKNNGQRPTMGILEVIENSNDFDWQESERFWIDVLRLYGCRLLNLYSGGHGGRIPSLETRQKMSLARKGKPFSESHRANLAAVNRARVLSPETIERLSKQRKGKPRSSETKAKLSKAHTGKKLSEIHKHHLALAGIGRRHTQETLEKMRIIALAREKQKRENKHL